MTFVTEFPWFYYCSCSKLRLGKKNTLPVPAQSLGNPLFYQYRTIHNTIHLIWFNSRSWRYKSCCESWIVLVLELGDESQESQMNCLLFMNCVILAQAGCAPKPGRVLRDAVTQSWKPYKNAPLKKLVEKRE